MFHKMDLPLSLLVVILAIGSGDTISSVKLPEPPQDGATGIHLHNGLDDCGEDTHSSCDSWAKSGECEKDPFVKQNCSFSCSISGRLWEAAWTGNFSTVANTIAAGASSLCPKTPNVTGYPLYNFTAIHLAASAGHPGIVNKLLNAGVDVNLQTTEGKTPIYIAATKGNIDALDILIENNANINIPDSGGMTPLMGAALSGNLNISKALINANASLDVTGGWRNVTALNYAVWESNQDVALLLIEHNANVNIPRSDGKTPLMAAAGLGELNIARALIMANASLDVTGGVYNATALYYAVWGSNQDVALLLIEHNANINIPDSRGWTPLMAAAGNGELNIINALISANASLDMTGGYYNATALHYAVRASLDVTRGWSGAILFHYAAEENYQDIVILLMDNGADSSITSKLGFTPADLARSEGHNQLADLIESYPTTHRLILIG